MTEPELELPPSFMKLLEHTMTNLTPAQGKLCEQYLQRVFGDALPLDDLPRPTLIAVLLFAEAAFGAYIESIKAELMRREKHAELDQVLNVEQFFQQEVMPELPEYWEKLEKLDAILEADILIFDEAGDEQAEHKD